MNENEKFNNLDEVNDEDRKIVERFGLDNLKELDDMEHGRIEYKRFNNVHDLMEDLMK